VPEGSKGSRIGIVFEEHFDRRQEALRCSNVVLTTPLFIDVVGFTGTHRRARSVRDVGAGKTTMFFKDFQRLYKFDV
jgi:hypothetical protein